MSCSNHIFCFLLGVWIVLVIAYIIAGMWG